MKQNIALVAAALIALTGLTGCSDSLDEDEAIASCQVQVQEKLKDPSSVSFDRGAEKVTSSGEDRFTVRGTGRGNNSFGGVAPFSFVCSVHKDSDGDVWVKSSLSN